MQRLERARLADGVVAAEQELRLAPDRSAEVLELEAIRVDSFNLDALDAVVAAQLDPGRDAVPRIVDEERSLAADRLELAATGEGGPTVENGDDAAAEAERPRGYPVRPAGTEPRLRVCGLRLSREKARA